VRAAAVDVRDALGAISTPTLLIYGENVERAPLRGAGEMHQAVTASKLVVLPTW
jgi:pimeloyl-ACP methyl ester carboxylesterase